MHLAPDASIDLQLHTTYSDGKWTPDQLVDHLVAEGFALAAITDHDRVDTAAANQQLAREKGFPLLVAAELTTNWGGKMTDVLCFGFDPAASVLQALAASVFQHQQDNSRQVFDTLRRQGFPFAQNPDALLPILAKPSAAQPHELVALVQHHADQIGDIPAGNLVWQAGADFASTEIGEVVDAVHQSGGLVLIAHPGRGDGYVTFDADLLDQLRRDVPIDGFEAYYPRHTPAQTAMFLEYAQRHGLLVSSGSDSHSPDKLPIKYPAAYSRRLLERLGIRIG